MIIGFILKRLNFILSSLWFSSERYFVAIIINPAKTILLQLSIVWLNNITTTSRSVCNHAITRYNHSINQHTKIKHKVLLYTKSRSLIMMVYCWIIFSVTFWSHPYRRFTSVDSSIYSWQRYDISFLINRSLLKQHSTQITMMLWVAFPNLLCCIAPNAVVMSFLINFAVIMALSIFLSALSANAYASWRYYKLLFAVSVPSNDDFPDGWKRILALLL